MGRKTRRKKEEEKERGIQKKKHPSKLQASWNNLRRQKERGQSKAGEGSSRNRPMKEDLFATREKKMKMLTQCARARGSKTQGQRQQSAVNPF